MYVQTIKVAVTHKQNRINKPV